MNDLLYEFTGLVGFCLVPESDESSDNVSNESSEDDEDKESDKFSIYIFCRMDTFLFPHCIIITQ